MSETTLLAVVEVEQSDRVQCSAPGCGHSVYKEVHIVRQDGSLRVYGSTCFSKLFRGTDVAKSKPRYTAVKGRPLTLEERLLLIENTSKLIDQFELELVQRTKPAVPVPHREATSNILPQIKHWSPPAKPIATAEQRVVAEAEARRRLHEKYSGVNFDLPGFRGMLDYEIDQILRESIA